MNTLRRSLSIIPQDVDMYMKRIYLDLKDKSNLDIRHTTNNLLKGKFKHPRANQMSAAARYGWKISPNEAFKPEEWIENIRITHSISSYIQRKQTDNLYIL